MTKLRNQFFTLAILLAIVLLLVLVRTYAGVPSLNTLLYPPTNANHQLTEENIPIFYTGIILGFGLNMIIITLVVFFGGHKIKYVKDKNEEIIEQKRAHILGKIDELKERYENMEKVTRTRTSHTRSEKLKLSEKNG